MRTKNRMRKRLTHNKTHKRQANTKKYKQMKCSPDPEKNEFSCYSNDDLFKLKDRWNMRHPDNKINSNVPKEIWATLQSYLSSVCNKESCWLKQNFMPTKDAKELLDSFAPKSPDEWKKNPTEWLSSVDILNVMKQYEKAYKCFEFLGPSPIDYDEKELNGETVWPEISNFNLESQIKSGKTKIGLIFNTDTHNKPGSHWISMFINIKKKLIFFFDSAGDKIPDRLKKFVNNVTEQGRKLSPPIHFKFDENAPLEHQYGNTECGVYSLFFIVHMLEDKTSAHYLKTHALPDKYMNKFRKVYFNEDL